MILGIIILPWAFIAFIVIRNNRRRKQGIEIAARWMMENMKQEDIDKAIFGLRDEEERNAYIAATHKETT